jgi:hypothetical protein
MQDAKEEDDILKLMEVIMKEILETMLLMVSESMLIKTDINMKDNGKIIFQMVEERLFILMEVSIMDIF